MRALLALLLGLLPQAAPLPGRVVDLGPREGATAWAVEDLDLDGRPEVLVLLGRTVEVFAGAGAGDPGPPATGRLPEDSLAFDVGDADGDPAAREIAVLTPAGVFALDFREGSLARAARPVLVAPVLSAGSPSGPPPRVDFLRDLDGDGAEDLLLPTARGLAVYYRGTGGADPWPAQPDRLLPCRLRSSLEPAGAGLAAGLRARIEIPAVVVADFTGDGRADLALDDGRRLRIFPAEEDGRVRQEEAEEIDYTPLLGGDPERTRVRIVDITGDGRSDFLVVRPPGTVEVHLAGGDPARPAWRAEVPGACPDPIVTDLDGDGRPDLVLPVRPAMGVATALSVAVTGTISTTHQVLLGKGDPATPFPEPPGLTISLRTAVALVQGVDGALRTDRPLLADYSGDFDGDGHRDLLRNTGAGRAEIHLGTPHGVPVGPPSAGLDIPSPVGCSALEAFVGDLDGDGHPDAALFYRGAGEVPGRVVLLLTRTE